MNMVWFWYVADGLPLQGREARAEALRGGDLPQAAARPGPPWARAREVSIPIGHRRAVRAPLSLRRKSPVVFLWLAMFVSPTLDGPVWDGSAAAYPVICS